MTVIVSLISWAIYWARSLLKMGGTFGLPWAKAIGGRYWLFIGAGVALFVLPYIINNFGRRAVVLDVVGQAGKILTMDAVENMNLARELAKIEAELVEADKQFEAMKKKVKHDKFEDDAIDWANSPVPMSIRMSLGQQ